MYEKNEGLTNKKSIIEKISLFLAINNNREKRHIYFELLIFESFFSLIY